MHRKFHKLIIASFTNETARGIVNACFVKAREEVEAVLGGINLSSRENNDSQTADVIQNPKSKTKK